MKFRIFHFKKLSSTQDKAKEFAKKGYKEGTVIVSEIQTKGRGRLNRKWFSNKGGLYFSVIIKPKKTDELPFLVFKSAIAVCDAIKNVTKLDAKLKWPNDVIYKNKKLCGILLESNFSSKLDYVIAGIGINANNKINKSLSNIATSLKKESNKKTSINKLLKGILNEFNKKIKLTTKKTIQGWKKRNGILGKRVEINKGKIKGLAVDVDEDCNLLIKKNNGEIKKIQIGDISLII